MSSTDLYTLLNLFTTSPGVSLLDLQTIMDDSNRTAHDTPHMVVDYDLFHVKCLNLAKPFSKALLHSTLEPFNLPDNFVLLRKMILSH